MSPPDGVLSSGHSKVRELTSHDLRLDERLVDPTPTNATQLLSHLDESDARLQEVRALLKDGYAGVIFTGPPGTSKSYYAEEIAAVLAERDPRRVRHLQFHPSYQYEDFVEGYVPIAGGGFQLKPKHLLQMCDEAHRSDGKPCVIVIHELSRTDPSRVFGEALTYIETSRRGFEFSLSSGTRLAIPANLVFLATMNPFDRGVDEVDAALERRFAKIAMDPDADVLQLFLNDNSMEPSLAARIVTFFNWVQLLPDTQARIGHAFFRGASDEDELQRLWDHQLRFFFEKAYRLNAEGFRAVERNWTRIFEPSSETTQPPTDDGIEVVQGDEQVAASAP